MPINFPSSPETNQYFTSGGTTWIWDGSKWNIYLSPYAIYQASPPSGTIAGQIWIDSDDNRIYVYNGSSWILATPPGSSYQTSSPSSPSTGQIWIDSDDSNKLYVWTGSAWQSIAIQSGANGSIALNSNTISQTYTFPVGYNGMSSGPLTIDDGVIITIPNGSEWSIV
jgi:hypothetical protein